MAGNELSKSSKSPWPPLDVLGAPDVKSPSPPSKSSSSPSATVAALVLSPAANRSASSPKAARSRSRKLPGAAEESGRTSLSPGTRLESVFVGWKQSASAYLHQCPRWKESGPPCWAVLCGRDKEEKERGEVEVRERVDRKRLIPTPGCVESQGRICM